MLEQDSSWLNPGREEFFKRWGCYWCSILAAGEVIAGKELNYEQILALFGCSVLNRWIFHANYKNHDKLYEYIEGWGRVEDPEFHFLVSHPTYILRETLRTLSYPSYHKFNIEKGVKKSLVIVEHATRHGSHFLLTKDEKVLYNPDPSVKIEMVISYRNIVEK